MKRYVLLVSNYFVTWLTMHTKKLRYLFHVKFLWSVKFLWLLNTPTNIHWIIGADILLIQQVLEMERQVLNVLGFHLSTPTPKQFVRLNTITTCIKYNYSNAKPSISPLTCLSCFPLICVRRFLRAAYATSNVRLAPQLFHSVIVLNTKS